MLLFAGMTDEAQEERELSEHVLEGIEAIVALQEEARAGRTRHELAVDSLSAVMSRPATIYLVVAICGMWCVGNLVAAHVFGHSLDPAPFFFMQSIVCLGALVVALVFTAGQRQAAAVAEQRANLDLQVNILAEKKLAKLIALVEELRRDLPQVRNREDPEAVEMSKPADPANVARELDSKLNRE
jgi:uncharacterized membrane protein